MFKMIASVREPMYAIYRCPIRNEMSAALVKCIALTPEGEVVAIVLNDSDNFVEAKTAWPNKEFVTFTNEVTFKRE